MLAGLYGCVLALILVMRFAPQSPLGRVLIEQLVERPIAWAAGLRSHQLIAVLLLGGVFLVGGEFVMLVGPHAAVAFALDLSIYLDAVVVSVALATAGRLKGAAHALKGRLSAASLRLRTAQRRRRAPKTPMARRAKPAHNDDEPDAAWALAA